MRVPFLVLALTSAAAWPALAQQPASLSADQAASSEEGSAQQVDPRKRAAELVQEAAQIRGKEPAKARELLLEARGLDGANLEVLIPLAELQLAARQLNSAYSTLVRALNVDGRHPVASRLFGEVLEARNDPNRAAKAYVVAAEQNKDAGLALKAGRLAPLSDPITVFEGFRLAALFGKVGLEDLPKYGAAAVILEKHADVVEIHSRIVEAEPANVGAHLAVSRSAIALKDHDRAHSHLQAAHSAETENLEVLEGLAELARLRGEKEESRKWLQMLVAVSAEHPTAFKQLALLEEAEGKQDQALVHWSAHHQIAPEDVEANLALGKHFLNQKDAGSAIDHAELAVKAADSRPAAHLLLGRAHYLAGDCAAAVDALRKGLSASDSAEPRAELGHCLVEEGKLKEARKHLSEALERDAALLLALESLAEVAEKEQKLEEAAELRGRAASHPQRWADAGAQLRAAERYLIAGLADKAEPFVNQTLELAPDFPKAGLLKGRIHLGRFEFTQALELLRPAAAMYNDDADAQAWLARALLGAARNDEAKQAAQAALELDAGHPLGNEVLGNALFPQPEALPHLEAALKGNPEKHSIQNLSELQLEGGDSAGSRRTLASLASASDPRTVWLRARTEVVAGELRTAENLLAPALLAHPADVRLHELAGNVAFERGQMEAARERLRKAALLERGEWGKLSGAALENGEAASDADSSSSGSTKGPDSSQGRTEDRDGESSTALSAETGVATSGADSSSAASQSTGADKGSDAGRAESTGVSAESRSADAERASGSSKQHPGSKKQAALGQLSESPESESGASNSGAQLSGLSLARLAQLAMARNNFDETIRWGRLAIARGHDQADVRAIIGYAHFRQEDFEQSKMDLALAVNMGANDTVTNRVLGQIALAEGREEEATGWFEKALALDENDRTSNALSGAILVRRGKYEEAIPRLEKAFSAKPDVEVGIPLAKASLSTGRHVRAQRVLQAIPEDEIAPVTALTLNGRIAHALGNYRQADSHFARALELEPDDADANFYRGQNYLKLPHYDNAIAHLERAAKVDPDRPEIAHELARLYAENNQHEKAAEALNLAQELEQKQVEERRKQIPANEIRRVVVASFTNTSGRTEEAWLSLALSRAIANDIAKSPYIQLLEREDLEKVKAEGLAQLLEEDSFDESTAAQFGRIVAADSVLVGSYLLVGDTLQINARLVDISTSAVTSSGSATGLRDDFSRLQKTVALELLGEYVPLNEEDRLAVARGGSQNVESLRLMTLAQAEERAGNVREAQALYREAVQADQGSAAALAGLRRNLEALDVKNRMVIADFQKGNPEAADWVGGVIHNLLSSKLPQVQGIQVLDRQEHSAIDAEKLLALDEDNVDQSSLPEFDKELVAGLVLVGSYNTGGGQVLINARLIDVEDRKVILGEQVSGPEDSLLELSNELAERIVHRLVGAPTQEELAILRQKQELEEFSEEMKFLTALEAERKARELDKERLAGLPPDSPERMAAEERSRSLLQPLKMKHAVRDENRKTGGSKNVFWLEGRLGVSEPMLGGLSLSLGARQGKVFLRGFSAEFESSNFLSAGRGSDEPAYGLYGLGYNLIGQIPVTDWMAFNLGGQISLAQVSSRRAGFQDEVETGFAAGVAPKAGMSFNFGNWGLNADVSRRFLFNLTGNTMIDPLEDWFVHAGLSYLMSPPAVSRKPGLSVGYRAHMVMSTGVDAYRHYGSVAGFRYIHGVLLGVDQNRGSSGLFLGYGQSASALEGADALGYGELAWETNFRAFKGNNLLNPIYGFRVGLAGFGDGAEGLYGETAIGLTGALRVGVDVTTKHLVFTPAVGYDFMWSTANGGRNDLGGFTMNLGAALRR